LMELRDYLKVIRARWYLIALGVLVVVGAALAYSYSQKPTYQGQAEVIVLKQQNGGAILLGSAQDQLPSQPDQSFVLTQAQVIQSPALAERVIASLDLSTSATALLQRVTASTDGQSNIVTIDAFDASATGAAETANAFAEAYVTWSRDSQVESIKAAGDQIEQRLKETQARVDALTRPKGGVTAATTSDLRIAEALRATLAAKLEQLRINQELATGSASVLASAVVDPNPVSPNHTRDGALGLAIGLLVGLATVFLTEQLDTKIRTPQEAVDLYGAPVIGSIPAESLKKNGTSRLTVVHRPASSAAEAYRGLRIGLDFINFKHEVKTLLVTSAVPSEGKSTVAANLAVALAQAGKTVVLLGCDFHRPTTGALFDLKGDIGLSEVLSGAHGIGDALQGVPGIGRLSVVIAGQTPPNPSELLGSSRMEALINNLRETVDWIILDAPPVLATADAASVVRLADGVLIVTRSGVTTREDTRAARDQLANIGARVLGLVVWGMKKDSAAVRVYSGYASH
jgi:succinoglycan biosynthesis transport protein ExoP